MLYKVNAFFILKILENGTAVISSKIAQKKAGSFCKHRDDVSSDWIGLTLGAGVDSIRHSEALWWKRQTYAGHYGNGSAWKSRQVQQSLVKLFIHGSSNILIVL